MKSFNENENAIILKINKMLNENFNEGPPFKPFHHTQDALTNRKIVFERLNSYPRTYKLSSANLLKTCPKFRLLITIHVDIFMHIGTARAIYLVTFLAVTNIQREWQMKLEDVVYAGIDKQYFPTSYFCTGLS